jgi:hypothetical protein
MGTVGDYVNAKGEAWGEISWDGEKRRIHVYVDWDYLTADEARELADWLLKAAAELEAESKVGA